MKKSSISNTTGIFNYIQKNGIVTKKELEDNGFKYVSQSLRELELRGYKFNRVNLGNGKAGGVAYEFVGMGKKREYNRPKYIRKTAKKTESVEVVEEPAKDEMEEMREKLIVPKSAKGAVLDYLLKHRKITSYEAMKKFNCTSLPRIIFSLRAEGYNITKSVTREDKNYNNKIDRIQSCCTYYLEEAPKPKKYRISIIENMSALAFASIKLNPTPVDALSSEVDAELTVNRLVNGDIMILSSVFNIFAPKTRFAMDWVDDRTAVVYSVVKAGWFKKVKTLIRTYKITEE